METLFVVFFSLFFTLFNSLHVITQWISNPPSRFFTGIAHYYTDYFLYADQIAQGANGSVIASAAHFTNESVGTTWIYWFYTIIGWFGHAIGLSPFAVYNIALIILVFFLCLLWYNLTKLLYPRDRAPRFISFLFILTASSFFDINGFLSAGRIDLLSQFWFSPAPAFNRLGGVPHQVFQTILYISLVIIYGEFLERISNKKNIHLKSVWLRLFLLTGLVFIAANLNPIQMIVFLTAATVTNLWYSRTSLPSVQALLLLTFGILAVSGGLGAWLTNLAFNTPLYIVAKNWEMAHRVVVDLPGMILAIGPIAVLIPFGIVRFLKHAGRIRILFFWFGASSFAYYYSPIPQLFGTVNVRWIHPASYGLLAVLATEGLMVVSHTLYRVTGKKIMLPASQFFLLTLYLLITIPTLYSQLDIRTNPALNTVLASNLNHVPEPVIEAFAWLKKQPDGGMPVVMTDPALTYDIIVPVFTGKISFTGHPAHTLYPDVKETKRSLFFEGKMSESESEIFLKNHRIGWIITGKQTVFSTRFMTKKFENILLNIYQTHVAQK